MLKRCLDIAAAALLLALLSPLLVLIAALVLLDSGRPVLYSQQRMGRNFRRFRIYKFRSMGAGLAGPAITAAGDVRVTRAGRLLRATKLDELPQLWNVLRGDMSLVGPRPEVQEYVELFRARYARVLTVRPGLTDLASLRYRDEERILAGAPDPLKAYRQIVLPAKLDLAEEYVRRHSLASDLSILGRTLWVCLTPRALPCPSEQSLQQSQQD